RTPTAPRDLGGDLLHLPQQFEHALAGFVALERVQVGEPRQRRESLVPLGVVLHRTRPQRIEIGVDRHVPRGQVDVVADQVNLAHFGQRRRILTQGGRRDEGGWGGRRRLAPRQQVTAPPRVAQLEQQSGRLVLVHVFQTWRTAHCLLPSPLGGEGRKRRQRSPGYVLAQARARRSISSRVRFSVTATLTHDDSSRYHRPSARPA